MVEIGTLFGGIPETKLELLSPALLRYLTRNFNSGPSKILEKIITAKRIDVRLIQRALRTCSLGTLEDRAPPWVSPSQKICARDLTCKMREKSV